MDERNLNILEFPKVIKLLESKASTSLGKELILSLKPINDLSEVTHTQEETREGLDVIRLKGGLPLGGIRDIRSHLRRATIGGDLASGQLLEISNTLYAGRKLRRFIMKLHDEHRIPILLSHADEINELQDLEQEINNTIDENGEIKDSASPELKKIRNQIVLFEGRIKEKLEQIIRNPHYLKMLQETIITVRNGRYAIPVKQEYRSVFGGMVHDQSASGATLFIEPEAVVQINNQLKEQKIKEEKEIEKILRQLSISVSEVAEELEINVNHLARLDFIQSKAELAREMKAIYPKLNQKGYINYKKARHPLIPKEEIVPIDVNLGKDYSSIIITGPNTGGKTVTLKTIGLLAIMAMSGLHIPAEEGSETAIFSSVFADIGDEQSIEQSLSTFSGHLRNIIKILQALDSNSLVLLDELGAGTDPTEGAALAIAILEQIRSIKARVVATTHYSELKAYAFNSEDVMNASVEFDVKTLRPTYRLLIGVPGRSNAFAIAKRLGLSDEIIYMAKSQISEDNLQVESMIASLEDNQRTAEKERLEAENLRKEAKTLHEALDKKLDALDNERNKMLDAARKEAEEVIRKARNEAELIIAELRDMAKEEQTSIKEHKLIEMKKRLEDSIPDDDLQMKKRKKNSNQRVKVGDEVKILSLNQKGTVIEVLDKKECLVQIGIIKTKVQLTDIELMKQPKQEKAIHLSGVKREYHVKSELDVRGKTVEDAMMEIDQYLDQAFMGGYGQISIIHGKGTGALRSGLQDFLRKHPHVKAIRLGQMGEGGSGVTVAELK